MHISHPRKLQIKDICRLRTIDCKESVLIKLIKILLTTYVDNLLENKLPFLTFDII